MAFQAIRYEQAQGVGVLTLNRPELRNALSRSMRQEITQVLRDAPQAADPARVLVLTGAGAGFCSGQDLTEAASAGLPDFEAILREEYEPMLAAIRDCPVPVIAAVNGVAAGAGANLALACDVVIAAESAQFLQAFTRIGLMPDAGGTWILPRLVGHARAMGAMLFGQPVSAAEAADWGMIWQAVPDEAFEAHWRTEAAHLARGPGLAYREIKRALQAAAGQDLPAQLAHEAAGQARCGASADFREGVAAFLEKRPARFTGH